ncbi:MAG: selenium cofactor biosynthesis protein YqeC [Elusimicrobiota bacterium]|nr:selenium cofactor biosynthesis protein YqeC [Elusimicrobiota bacterium]
MQPDKHFDHLISALNLNPKRDIISIVGAGGKTTVLRRLAKELDHINKKVILTTTTHLELLDFPLIRYSKELTPELITRIEQAVQKSPPLVVKRKVKGNKLKGLSLEQIAALNKEVAFDYMLIEADGANHKSLKAPHRWEPRVPPCTSHYIVVVGYDILGKKLNAENVHRPQLVARATKRKLGEKIRAEDILLLLRHPDGLLKRRPSATRTTVILNKVSERESLQVRKLAKNILKSGAGITSVVYGELNKPRQLILFK